MKEWFRQSEIEDFAQNLEVARIMLARFPQLVQAETFPEPYRSSIRSENGYDPELESHLDVSGLHISDPAAAERYLEDMARSGDRRSPDKKSARSRKPT